MEGASSRNPFTFNPTSQLISNYYSKDADLHRALEAWECFLFSSPPPSSANELENSLLSQAIVTIEKSPEQFKCLSIEAHSRLLTFSKNLSELTGVPFANNKKLSTFLFRLQKTMREIEKRESESAEELLEEWSVISQEDPRRKEFDEENPFGKIQSFDPTVQQMVSKVENQIPLKTESPVSESLPPPLLTLAETLKEESIQPKSLKNLQNVANPHPLPIAKKNSMSLKKIGFFLKGKKTKIAGDLPLSNQKVSNQKPPEPKCVVAEEDREIAVAPDPPIENDQNCASDEDRLNVANQLSELLSLFYRDYCSSKKSDIHKIIEIFFPQFLYDVIPEKATALSKDDRDFFLFLFGALEHMAMTISQAFALLDQKPAVAMAHQEGENLLNTIVLKLNQQRRNQNLQDIDLHQQHIESLIALINSFSLPIAFSKMNQKKFHSYLPSLLEDMSRGIDFLLSPALLALVIDKILTTDFEIKTPTNEAITPIWSTEDRAFNLSIGKMIANISIHIITLGSPKGSFGKISVIITKILKSESLQQNMGGKIHEALIGTKNPKNMMVISILRQLLWKKNPDQGEDIPSLLKMFNFSDEEHLILEKKIGLELQNKLYSVLIKLLNDQAVNSGVLVSMATSAATWAASNMSSLKDFCAALSLKLYRLTQQTSALKILFYYQILPLVIERIEKKKQAKLLSSKSKIKNPL